MPMSLASHRPDTPFDLYAQYNPNGTKMHFNRISNHTMHKFPQHFDNVSEFNVSNRSDAHEGLSQTQTEMRREFIEIGEEWKYCTLSHFISLFSRTPHKNTEQLMHMIACDFTISRVFHDNIARTGVRVKGESFNPLRSFRGSVSGWDDGDYHNVTRYLNNFTNAPGQSDDFLLFFSYVLYFLWNSFFSVFVVFLPLVIKWKPFSTPASSPSTQSSSSKTSDSVCFYDFLCSFPPFYFIFIAAFVISYFMIHLTAKQKQQSIKSFLAKLLIRLVSVFVYCSWKEKKESSKRKNIFFFVFTWFRFVLHDFMLKEKLLKKSVLDDWSIRVLSLSLSHLLFDVRCTV